MMNKSDFRIIEKPSGKFYVQRVFEDTVKVGVWPFRKNVIQISWSYLDEYGMSTPAVPTRLGRHIIIRPKAFKSLKAAYKWIDQFCTPVKYHYPVEVTYSVDVDPFIKALKNVCNIPKYENPPPPPKLSKDRQNAGS